MRYVVDCSVVTKWFLPEIDDDVTLRLHDSRHDFVAPDLLIPELTKVFSRLVKQGGIEVTEARNFLRQVGAKFELVSSRELAASALDIATQFDRSAYDSLYVALAVRDSCRLITADRRLYDAVRATLPNNLLFLSDMTFDDADA